MSAAINCYAQGGYCPPPNIGFERGNFDNWECDTGRVDANGGIQVVHSDPIDDRQTICSGGIYGAYDPYGNFPMLCPNGSGHSIRLGNNKTGAGAERVSYTFTVPPGANQYDLIFNYAVVLQNPKHADYQQPRFTVKTFDLTDNTYVACASFDFIAASNLPGFKLAPPLSKSDTQVYYKGWTPSTINLKGYAGKQMRLEFTTNDCTKGGHFGYAYVDVNEDCNSPVTGNTYCTGEKYLTFFAPGGFGNYTWYTGDLQKVINVGPTLVVSPPPPDQTKYAVVLTPYNGLGCTDTLYTTVNKIPSGFTFTVPDTIYACAGSTVNLAAPAITAGSSSDLTLSYFNDPYGFSFLYDPRDINTSGTYYIKATAPSTCSNILPVTVIIGNPVIKAENPPTVVYPQTVDISTTFAHNAKDNYTYFASDGVTPIADYRHIYKTGTYYIRGTGPAGCTTTVPVYITVTPPPPPLIKAPNTFTPNNDGINDYFSLSISGYGEFGSLRVYDRYGRLVFQTRSKDARWDGKYNESFVSTGTYYWVFEGRNTYYNTKIVESGFIAVIR